MGKIRPRGKANIPRRTRVGPGKQKPLPAVREKTFRSRPPRGSLQRKAMKASRQSPRKKTA